MTIGNTRRLLLVLLGAVGLLLLIGCANIASLLLARSAARAREFAIRAAIGARRGALIRQLLTESCVLAVIGGALGILIARFGLDALIRFSPPDLPRMVEGIPIDGTTLAFTALLTMATALLFGLVPALQASHSTLGRELAETARGSSVGPQRQFSRAAMVVCEIALSLVLLVAAGLTIRSFERLLSQDLGFVAEHLVTTLISLPEQHYPGQPDRTRIFDPLLKSIRAIPGVEFASYAFGAPLTDINNSLPVTIRGAPLAAVGESASAGYAQVSPGYFETLKTSLLEGRDFTDQDNTNTPPVVIVDEMFVKSFNLGGRVIGQRIDIGDGTQNAEIVGLVKQVKRTGMADSPRGEMYRPYRQLCWGVVTLVVRTQRSPADTIQAIRREIDLLDKDLPMESVRTMTQLIAGNVAQRRLSMQLLSGFAAVALLLSALGLYGVVSYTVSQRTREIGIRVALGAQKRAVIGLVIGQGMRLAVVGLMLGLVGAFMVTPVLRWLLFEIQPRDLITFTIVPLALAVVALIACWLPARHAARVDPVIALRTE